MRHACPKFVRQSFHEFAACSIRFCVWARCFYESQLKSDKKHHAAVRALAFKWQRIMWRCWQDHTPYDDAKYVEAPKRSDSALYARVMAAPAEAKGQKRNKLRNKFMHQIEACQLSDGLGALRIAGALKSVIEATAGVGGGPFYVKHFRYERCVDSGCVITLEAVNSVNNF